MRGADMVFHLAANADVRFGTEHPRKDLEQNTIATFNVLEAMRANGVRRIAFSSTGSIYGEAPVIPTPEDAPFPDPDVALRRVEARRRRLDPGVLRGLWLSGLDLPLRVDPGRTLHARPRVRFLQEPERRSRPACACSATVRQRKSYLYVQDCLDAILLAMDARNRKVNVFNLGTDEFCHSERLNRLDLLAHLGMSPRLDYTGGDRGWIGDNPFIYLDTARIRALGWTPEALDS